MTAGAPPLTMQRPDNGLPEEIRDHMRLMCDIIALAFQTDKTRVATLLLCRDLSGLFYPFLDVRTAHHPASHDDQSEAYQRVSRYDVSQLAYLAGRLDAMPEGEQSVLDHSVATPTTIWGRNRTFCHCGDTAGAGLLTLPHPRAFCKSGLNS